MDILISGTGIAGPVLAYWLLQRDPAHRITLLERSPDLRATGQSIDIRQAAVDVVSKMGLLDTVRAHTTREAGIEFVDERGKAFARFGASGNQEAQSFTSEFEILRGDLVNILYDAVKDRVTTIFGVKVDQYTDDASTGGKVDVLLSNGHRGSYDVLVAADGQSSRIRNVALGITDTPRKYFRVFNNYAAYFTMPAIASIPRTDYAQWYNSTGGRVLFMRPDTNPNMCRANIVRQLASSDKETNARYRNALTAGPEEYKRILGKDYVDAGWISDPVLRALAEATDFYASETLQVQLPTLSVGRVAFVGDAGYCPSPLTGMGTSLAIIGAYVLAGELGKVTSQAGVVAALSAYNDVVLPYSRKVQNIPTTVPAYLNPQSSLGLWIVRMMLWIVSATGIASLVGRIAGSSALSKKDYVLPDCADKAL
jgi:2-polyprenyl-6-methoxyphenol hydroxylase-like FAD-dependent oxidoreductase